MGEFQRQGAKAQGKGEAEAHLHAQAGYGLSGPLAEGSAGCCQGILMRITKRR